MATITSAQSGNFHVGSTWVGGVVPGAGDVAVATTGHTVSIVTDITVGELRTINTSGYFSVNSGRTINGNIRGGSTVVNNGTLVVTGTATINGSILQDQGTASTVVVIIGAGASGGSLTVNGTVTGGAGAGRYAITVPAGSALNGYTINVTGEVNCSASSASGYAISLDGGSNIALNVIGNVGTVNGGTAIFLPATTTNPTCTVTGNVRTIASSSGFSTIYLAAAGTVTVNGPLTGAGSTTTAALTVTGTGATAIVNGDVTVTTNTTYCLEVGPSASATVTGNVSVGTSNANPIRTASTVTVNGNVTSSTTSGSGSGIVSYNAAANVTVNGNVTGATGAATGTGVNMSAGGTIRVNGALYATANTVAVTGAADAVLLLNGTAYSSVNGRPAFNMPFVRFLAPAGATVGITSYTGTGVGGVLNDGVNLPLVSVADAGYPAEADVREDTVYAGGAYTGTLAVPSPASVAFGVPTDNTTGTASLSQASLVTIIGAQISAALSSPSV